MGDNILKLKIDFLLRDIEIYKNEINCLISQWFKSEQKAFFLTSISSFIAAFIFTQIKTADINIERLLILFSSLPLLSSVIYAVLAMKIEEIDILHGSEIHSSTDSLFISLKNLNLSDPPEKTILSYYSNEIKKLEYKTKKLKEKLNKKANLIEKSQYSLMISIPFVFLLIVCNLGWLKILFLSICKNVERLFV